MTYPPLHDNDNIFYTPIISGWRENPREALRIYALELANGEHPLVWLAFIAITLGAVLCASQ